MESRKETLWVNQSGITLVALIITIVSILILATVSYMEIGSTPDNAIRANVLTELSQVQEMVSIKRRENLEKNNKDYGFQSIQVLNAPSDFESISSTETKGYVVNLEYIGIQEGKYGKGYKTLDYENGQVVFGESDVFVYDKDGTVYFAKGITLETGETIYQVESN